jgi:hypothetical protein
MNEKAHTGRPRKVYEERGDGNNAERFKTLARGVLSVPYEAVKEQVEKTASKSRSASVLVKSRKRR